MLAKANTATKKNCKKNIVNILSSYYIKIMFILQTKVLAFLIKLFIVYIWKFGL